MKRLLAGLVAIFGLALFAPHQAQAAPADCVLANPTNSSYPYTKAYQCGTATNTDARTMADRVSGDGIVINELRRAGVTYYLYNTKAEYDADFPSHPTIVPSDAYGQTVYDAHNVPIYSAIFMHNGAGTANTHLTYTTNLQVADAGDFLLGYMSNGGVLTPVNARFSSSALFQGQASSDWTSFKGKTPCTTAATNHYQVFSTWADSTSVEATSTYNYVCNGTNGTGTALNAGYTGLAIDQVLNKAWPGVYTTGSGTSINLNYQGLFQQELAWLMSANDLSTPRSMSQIVSDPNGSQVGSTAVHSFQCTEYELRTIGSSGQLPPITDANRPAGCPTPALQQTCLKRFNQQGYWPDGNVFDCTAAHSTGINVESELNGLGGNSSNTLIKQRLSTIRSNVFIFDTQTAYHNAFVQAGVWDAGSTPVVLAGTYLPTSTADTWYTFINLSGYGGTYTTGNIGYTATHEVAHALDDSFGASQPSASAAFDLAMQHDWLNLDYTSWTSPTVFTLRGPCGSSPRGPFVGVYDYTYSPALLICNGTSLNTTTGTDGTSPSSRYSGKKNSDILRNARIEGIAGHGPLYNSTNGAAGPGFTSAPGWREWHSDSFATIAKTDAGTTPQDPTIPAIVGNGYFQCTAGPAASASYVYMEYSTGALPAPAPCQTSMPAGWVTDHQSTASP